MPPIAFPERDIQKNALYFDPWIETDRRGHAYLVYGRFRAGPMQFQRSRDGGVQWSKPQAISHASADRPVLGISPDGRIPAIAAAMSEKTADFPSGVLNGEDPQLAETLRKGIRHSGGAFLSDSFGTDWKQLNSPLPDAHAIPFSIVVNNTGQIAAGWIVEGGGSNSIVTISRNGGGTWEQTVLVDPLQPDRNHAFNGERFPVPALDGEGALHVADVDRWAGELRVRTSADWNT